jgi:hypothetical protein
MTALASPAAPTPTTRRQRAAATVDRVLRGAILGAAVAAVAWLLAGAIAATAFVILVIATVAAIAYTLMKETAPLGLWLGLVVAWAVVMLERWAVGGHGGLWVGAAAWLGMIVAARRSGISKWTLPLLGYPLALVAVVIIADQPVDDPWGSSWLWVPAILGPVLGARTLLNPSPKTEPKR